MQTILVKAKHLFLMSLFGRHFREREASADAVQLWTAEEVNDLCVEKAVAGALELSVHVPILLQLH